MQSVGKMHPSWGWLWSRVGVTGKLVVKMNIPVAVRNATTPYKTLGVAVPFECWAYGSPQKQF